MRHRILAALAVPALLLSGGCGRDPADATRVEGRDLVLEVELEPPVPRSGENHMRITVRDSAGNVLPAADVEVKVVMPAMGAMAQMGGPAPVKPMGDGRFEAGFDIAMDGTWRVDVRARAGDASLHADGSLITGQRGVQLSAREATGAAATPAAGAGAPGEVYVDVARRQKAGIRTAPVKREPFAVTIRAVGLVDYDQGTLHDVAPRVGGYVGAVQVPAPGNVVRAGQLLFTLYSPELFAAQQEYLVALASGRGDAVASAARGRLRLWGMSAADIDQLASSRAPQEYVPFRSPADGVVVEKKIVEGSGTTAGERLFRIASVDRVWVEAELYEADVALVRAGAAARVTLPYLPGVQFEGTVSLVNPFVDGDTRTARARIELANPGLAILPGMYATVELRRELGDRIVVPASAVLYAGERRFVFVDEGDGRLRPQAVVTGLRDGERLEVLSGLAPDQQIVVSGNYLIASESRFGTALEQW